MIERDAKASAWADPDSEVVRELLSQSSRRGWQHALRELEDREPVFVERMRNLSLGNWQLLVAPRERPEVLDVGCGFGTLTLGSSRFARRAIGIDPLPERIAYGSLRARESAVDNAAYLVADAFSLPFKPDSFDLVTLNGVLEWAGLFRDGAPVALQRQMLVAARRIAGSRGKVCVAIENSMAAETLLGLKDTHTGVHFFTAFPEPLSSFLLKLRTGEDPRVRLHGRGAYKGLFRSAGFTQTRLLSLIPSYNDYRFIVDTDDTPSHRFVYEHLATGDFYNPARRFRALLARSVPGALPRFSYAYLIVGQGDDDTTTLLEPEAAIWRLLEVPSELARFGVQMDSPGGLGILLHDHGGPQMLLKCWSNRVEEPEFPGHLRRSLQPCMLTERRRGEYGDLDLALFDVST